MKYHPKISEEEALKHVYSIMEDSLDELNWEFLNIEKCVIVAGDSFFRVQE